MCRPLVTLTAGCLLVMCGPPFSPAGRADETENPPAEKPSYQRLLQGDDAKKAAELAKRTTELVTAAKFADALTAAEELHQLRQRVQGADHWQTASARWTVEALRRIAAQPSEAQQAYAAVGAQLAEAERLRQLGRAALAEPIERRVLALRQQVLGEDHPLTAASYNGVGAALHGQGKYAAAEGSFRKALALREKLLGEEHPDTASSYSNLAVIANAQGKYPAAESLYLKSLTVRQKVLGEEHADTATSYNGVAVSLNNQGKSAAAEPLYQKALAIRRKVLGEEHHETATSYNNLGSNLHAQGRLTEGEPLFRKALAIREKVLGDEHPDTAQSYNNVGGSLNGQGQYAATEAYFRRALAIREKVLGEEHPHTAQSYTNLALSLNNQEKPEAAESFYRKALAINQKMLGEGHPTTAKSYDNVAFSLHAQGKHADAAPFRQKALAILEKVLGEDHPDTAVGYTGAASNLGDQGKHAAAEPLFRKALAVWQRALGEQHPRTVHGFTNLTMNLTAQGKHEEAAEVGRHAARGFEAARLAGSAAGLDRALFTAGHVSPAVPVAASLAHARQPAEAWQILESYLGRGLLEEITSRQASPTPEELQQTERLNRRLAELAPQVLALVIKKGPSDADRQRLEQLLKERDAVEAAKADLAIRATLREVANLAAVQAQLPADAALLAWLDFGGPKGAEDIVNEHWACLVKKTGLPVWVPLPGTGPNDAWSDTDRKLPDRVQKVLNGRPGELREEDTALLRQLAAQRLAPVERHLHGVKQLIVLPASSGAMTSIPLEALTDRWSVSYAPSATLYARLVQSRERERPGQPRLLALGDPAFRPPVPVAAKPPPEPPDHGVLLALVPPGSNAAKSGLQRGDVLLRYGDRKLMKAADLPPEGTDAVPVQVWRDGQLLDLTVQPGRLGAQPSRFAAAEGIRSQREMTAAVERSRRGGDYAALPGTRREVEAIRALFEQSDALLGDDASEPRLAQMAKDDHLKRYRFLHLATHGEVDTAQARKCALILAQDNLPEATAGQRRYDGRLDVGEILDEWKLDADLVTLSACETGLGQEAHGEGLMGFSQAFLSRGARSLVVSLWKVDDNATALLMVRFYQNLLGKRDGLKAPLPKAEALREAKQWLRDLSVKDADQELARLPQVRGRERERPAAKPQAAEKPFAHPYYWSAFILIGDPE